MRTQHVRFLSDVIKNEQANCIDGTVVMASILRKAGIEPYIILAPGHAMVGYVVDRERNIIDVIETTMLGNANFASALNAGNKKYADWVARYDGSNSLKVISVSKARAMGIMPIPR